MAHGDAVVPTGLRRTASNRRAVPGVALVFAIASPIAMRIQDGKRYGRRQRRDSGEFCCEKGPGRLAISGPQCRVSRSRIESSGRVPDGPTTLFLFL